MTRGINVGIVGTGIYLPKNKISANDIARMTNGVWTEEAVIEKLGIKEKFIASQDEGTQEMSCLAAVDCLKKHKYRSS